jgi:hypothetical protein
MTQMPLPQTMSSGSRAESLPKQLLSISVKPGTGHGTCTQTSEQMVQRT